MGRYIKGLIAAAVLAASLSAANAQATAQAPTQVLPQIVVSPTATPTPVDQVASSITVITAQDIERDHIETVPNALRMVPGLNVVQTGGPGGQTAVFMRGTGSQHVKVLIDGIDVGDPSVSNGAFDYAHLLTGDIERIEILRGPQSGLYGSDAIGGVISIITKKGDGPPRVTASFEGGSMRTLNQTVRLSGSQNRFNYAFNVLHVRAGSVPVTPLDLLAPEEQRNNDSYDNWTYSTKLGAAVTDDVTINLIGRYTDARHYFTGDNGVLFPPVPTAFQEKQVNHDLYTRAETVWSTFGGRFVNYFDVDYTNQRLWVSDPNADSFAPFGSVPPPNKNVGERVKGSWRGEATLAPGHMLVLGLEDERQFLRTTSTATAAGEQLYTKEQTGNKAGFVELQSRFADRVFIVANVRYDDNASFGPHTTWRVAPAFLVPVTDTKLKGSYGTGFKAPTLTELFVNNPSFGQIANPALRPEISTGYDYGFEQPLFDNRFRFGATYFRNKISDLINFSPLTAFTFTYINVGRAEAHGVEAFVSAAVTQQLTLRGDYTFTHTEDLDTGLGLLRRPSHKESASAIWTPLEQLTLSTTVVHVGTWVDTNRDTAVFVPRLDAKPYTIVNLAANYDIDKNVTVFAHIDNLFNDRYQVPVGFLQPGFGVFGGIRVTASAAELPKTASR
jgi:vitamin B12 transporter